MSSAKTSPQIIVQKYGGATVADPERIKQVAVRVAAATKNGQKLVVVVSAMGKTTNQLISLAQNISNNPTLREMDMLLSAGERISMSLLSMALNDLGCPAISFTGSQAGILTNESHVNALIVDVKAFRVKESIEQSKVVILAGFQGVSPITKEITTIGRGGSDLSAVAMATFLNAERCEILKDVPAIFSADPNLIKNTKPIRKLSYDQLLEMTFWGAKVLHYRSVELAKIKNVKLYIGPAAHDLNDPSLTGTTVEKENNMFETSKVLSVNSHELVLKIETANFTQLTKDLEKFQIAFPQVLFTERKNGQSSYFVTGPQEVLASIRGSFKQSTHQVHDNNYSSVSATCTGALSPELWNQINSALEAHKLDSYAIISSAMSLSFIVDQKHRSEFINALHSLA